MLRSFYILVCIQVCFCTDYIENVKDESLERIESATTRLHKVQTRKAKKSGIVQFDVQSFMKKPDDGNSDVADFVYRDRSKKAHGQYSANYGDYASLFEPNENNKERNDAVDYSKFDDSLVEWNRAPHPVKETKTRQSKNVISFDNAKIEKTAHAHAAASASNLPNVLTEGMITNPEKKCAFKNMKVPFFSSNKLTTKTARHHKRRMFCFNCHKTPTTAASTTAASTTVDEGEKSDSENDLNFNYEMIAGNHFIHKRAYDQLCPKCIRELLNNLKRKTTKRIVHQTKTFMEKTKSFKEKTTPLNKKDDNLDDSLKEDYINQGYVRKKRNEKEDLERERRLKELEEVEKKIENVHISPQSVNVRKINLNAS